ncbi:MAG: ABC transporter ATP-binding protein [Bacteroidales bacterium]|nr:ABC transporter ATP-binding protein [Bacteroidales bacterium]
MNPVEIHNVTKRFGSLTAVDNVSLNIGKGEIVGLLGANGAGKTTLIRMLCSLIKPDGGDIQVEGRIGYMCQAYSLIPELTVHENIVFYGALYGLDKEVVARREEQIASLLQLDRYLNRQVKHLPSGWRQSLSFSIAIIHTPEILILDEPTSGLDSLSRRRLWKMITSYAESGTSVLVSTHYQDEAYNCGRVAIMNTGHIIALGAPNDCREYLC